MLSRRHKMHCVILLLHLCLFQFWVFHFKPVWNATIKWHSFQISNIEDVLFFGFFLLNIYTTISRCLYAAVCLLGFSLYDCFPSLDHTMARKFSESNPNVKISFRTVSKGDYPELVTKNVERNREICEVAGLVNYIHEVVTEKRIDPLRDSAHVRQIVVPGNYRTKNGTLFKARNLQYCLEDGVSCLRDQDWIVHLDEDSVLTVEAVHGLLQFIAEGKGQIGQGLVKFDPEDKTSFAVKFGMAFRIGIDYGLGRFMGRNFSRLNCIIKGSFIASKVKTEKEIGFDGGVENSVTEFMYFASKANFNGIGIGCIEGHILEQSPIDLKGVILQNVRVRFGMANCFVVGGTLTPHGLYFSLFHYFFMLSAVFYPICFAFNLFDNGPYSVYFKMVQGITMAHDTYLGVLYCVVCRDYSILKLVVIYLVCIVIGQLYGCVLQGVAILLSWRIKKIKFDVTKKD